LGGKRELGTMNRQFLSELDQIKSQILTMGGCVEQALDHAIQALIHRQSHGFQSVHEIEKKINTDHKLVDEACLNFLAKQGPKAKDLRLIMSVIKINTDLERMGDQCVNIAYTGRDYFSRTALGELRDLELMSILVRKMVKDSLDAFVREDEKLAREILLMDDEVDRLKGKVFKDFTAHIQKSPQDAESALDVILIARNLERLGDHATNIAEDVIFVASGKDVRHGGDQQ